MDLDLLGLIVFSMFVFVRFLTDIYSEAHPGPSLRLKKTVQVAKLMHLIYMHMFMFLTL